MFKTNPGAPVSRIKFPSVVSAFALTTIRLPTLLNGMIHEMESLAKVMIETEFTFGMKVLSAPLAKKPEKRQRLKRKLIL